MQKLWSEKLYENFDLSSPSENVLNLVFHYVQSVRAHFPIIRSSLVFKNADLLLLCETWLNSSDSSTDYQLTDFQMFRLDHPSPRRQHAGSLIFIRNNVTGVTVTSRFIGNGNTTQFVEIVASQM